MGQKRACANTARRTGKPCGFPALPDADPDGAHRCWHHSARTVAERRANGQHGAAYWGHGKKPADGDLGAVVAVPDLSSADGCTAALAAIAARVQNGQLDSRAAEAATKAIAVVMGRHNVTTKHADTAREAAKAVVHEFTLATAKG